MQNDSSAKMLVSSAIPSWMEKMTLADLVRLREEGRYRHALGMIRRLRRRGKPLSIHHRRMRIKRSRADARWSDAVRTRDGWLCRYCGQQFDPPGTPDRKVGLEAAHIMKRGKPKTRLLVDNGLSLCGVTGLKQAPNAKPWDSRIVCHAWFEDHPKEWAAFVVEMIGQRAYDRLRILANR